jgi:hypothetical protein
LIGTVVRSEITPEKKENTEQYRYPKNIKPAVREGDDRHNIKNLQEFYTINEVWFRCNIKAM